MFAAFVTKSVLCHFPSWVTSRRYWNPKKSATLPGGKNVSEQKFPAKNPSPSNANVLSCALSEIACSILYEDWFQEWFQYWFQYWFQDWFHHCTFPLLGGFCTFPLLGGFCTFPLLGGFCIFPLLGGFCLSPLLGGFCEGHFPFSDLIIISNTYHLSSAVLGLFILVSTPFFLSAWRWLTYQFDHPLYVHP